MAETNFEMNQIGPVLYGTLVPAGSVSTFSLSLLAQIDAFSERIEQQEDIRAAIITGTGKTFCIGSDLSQIQKGLADGQQFHAYLTAFNKTMTRLENLPVPTVAAVNGLTRAGGLEIVLACDLAVISESALIGDAHSAQYAIPAGGSTQRLPRRIGMTRAKEFTWSGRFITAAEAVEWGLCYREVPAADLISSAEEIVGRFVDKPRPCLSQIKSLLMRSETTSIDDGVELEIHSFLNYVRNYPYVSDAIDAFKKKTSTL